MSHYSLHTYYGLARDTQSATTGQAVRLVQMALGDGNGQPINPAAMASASALVHELLRVDVNRVYVDPADPLGTYTVEAIAPPQSATYTVREAAVIDATGGMYTISSIPAVEIAPLTSGADTGLTIEIKLIATNGATIDLSSAGAVATMDWVEAQLIPSRTTPGGTTNQVWTKASNTDGDCEWRDPSTATVVVDTIEETIALVNGQTIVDLTITTTRGLAIYIDGERLPESAWTADESIATRLTLGTPVSGAGHQLIACQNEPTANTPTPLERSRNLSDLPSKATARTELDVYSRAEVDALLDLVVPIGTPLYAPGSSPPPRFLVRDGAAVSRATYAKLFAVIGTTFGSGNGLTTFNLPDDRGLYDRALDLGKGIDPGRTLNSIQQSTRVIADWKESSGAVGRDAIVNGGFGSAMADFESGSQVETYSGDEFYYGGNKSASQKTMKTTAARVRVINRARLPIIRAY